LSGHVTEMMAEMAGLAATRRRIEDDTGAHAPDDFGHTVLVEEKALRSFVFFPKLEAMNDATNWKVSKWPFLLGDALLLAFAYFIVWKSPHPIARGDIILCVSLSAIGSIVGCIPFFLDYRAFLKVVEANALGAVAEKIQNLEQLAAQISSATNEWTNAQTQAEKTSAGAREIAEKMAAEVRQFSEFMQKMNDSEKATLRLEADKLRRGELEWLQVLVRILDHVFALHAAAVRSDNSNFADPITNFQNACRGTARRIGLTPFVAEPDESFDAEKHQVAGSKEKPPEGSIVAETVAVGYTFQGKLLRPAIVRLRDGKSSDAKPVGESPLPELPAQENLEDELPVQSPD
jgi:molecular chaperone GrpE (heat shock protein)